MIVALVSDVFDDADGLARLAGRLRAAKSEGAELVLLPELPLNPWSQAGPVARDEDAELPAGPRHQALADAAGAADIGVVGGAIVVDAETGRRHNTALVFDRHGSLVAGYRKLHLPEEAGFWETQHYEPGDALPQPIRGFSMSFGLQICSDINRPEGAHLLAALGADAILNPRATEAVTFGRWRTVFVATAMTSCAYVLSVNRPREERGVALGGPSFAVAPTGDVLVETTDTLALVMLDPAVVERARHSYPGYLATRADLYARGWQDVRATRLPHEGRRRHEGHEGHEGDEGDEGHEGHEG
jgi:5-aminopentanamidase